MNIFYLDESPRLCAQMHCNKHVVKMILEYTQLLCTAHHLLDGPTDGLYKPTHKNHPSAVWVRQSRQHYLWLRDLLYHLHDEYTYRYSKIHKSSELLELLEFPPHNLADAGWSEPPQCMPDTYKCDDTVRAYQQYYMGDKAYMAKWHNAVPDWFRPAELVV